jgi:hypothetical protein
MSDARWRLLREANVGAALREVHGFASLDEARRGLVRWLRARPPAATAPD